MMKRLFDIIASGLGLIVLSPLFIILAIWIKLCPEEGLYGVDIPKGVWHNVECLESGSVFFECKEGPFVPHEEEGVLKV